jgi:hypothetical protein
MYRVWYWATVDRESDGRFIASIFDLEDLAAYGLTDKDAVEVGRREAWATPPYQMSP